MSGGKDDIYKVLASINCHQLRFLDDHKGNAFKELQACIFQFHDQLTDITMEKFRPIFISF